MQSDKLESSPTSVPLVDLTEHDVATVLTNLGLQRYVDAALAVPLRGADLLHCSEASGLPFRPLSKAHSKI